MNPEFQVNVWAKIIFLDCSHGNQRWKWWKPWSKHGLHPRKCWWHPCPASWCGRGWGCMCPKLLEQCRGLELVLALLWWEKAAVLVTWITPSCSPPGRLSHFWGLKPPSNIAAAYHHLIWKQVHPLPGESTWLPWKMSQKCHVRDFYQIEVKQT